MSLHKKDWLKIAGLLGLGATGLGAAGIGPMAGLFAGGAATGVGAGASALGAEAGAGLVGAVSPMAAEAYGGAIPALTAADSAVPSAGLLSNLNWDKGAKGLQLANYFAQQGEPKQQQMATRPPVPQQQLLAETDLEKLLKRIYGGMYG